MLDSSKIVGDHLRPYLRVADVQWGRINTDDLPEMDFDNEDRTKGSYLGRSKTPSLHFWILRQEHLIVSPKRLARRFPS